MLVIGFMPLIELVAITVSGVILLVSNVPSYSFVLFSVISKLLSIISEALSASSDMLFDVSGMIPSSELLSPVS